MDGDEGRLGYGKVGTPLHLYVDGPILTSSPARNTHASRWSIDIDTEDTGSLIIWPGIEVGGFGEDGRCWAGTEIGQ